MKFFVPAARDDKAAEEMYAAFVKFAEENTGRAVQKDRIYALEWVHSGQRFETKVGEPAPPYYREQGPVLAILVTRDMLLICTPNRGGLRGSPILVGENEVVGLTPFD